MFPLNTLNFEALADVAPALGGDTDPAPDSAPDTPDPEDLGGEPSAEGAPAPEAAPEPPPSGIDWDDPEVAQRLDDAADARIEAILAREQTGGGEQEQPFLLDPMADPQEFTQGMVGLFNQVLDQRLGPVDEIVQRQRTEDAHGFVDSTLAQIPEVGQMAELLPAPGEGQPDERQHQAAELAEFFSSGLLPQFEAQYGEGSQRAAQAALRAGSAQLHKTLTAVHAAGRASWNAEQEARAGAPRDLPGAGTSGVAQVGEPVVGDESSVVRKYFNQGA